jgi:Protein of unknown function (DUF3168)
MFEVGLINLLTTAPALTALIATRVYPVELPVNPTLPAIAFKQIGSQSQASFDGSGFQQKRIEFAVHASSYLAAITVKAALIKVLNLYTGLLSDGSFVSSSEQITGTDLFIADDLEYVCTQEFYFGFVATT